MAILSTEKKSQLKNRIRELAQPKTPIDAGVEADLKKLPEIRAVLFDVYGTTLTTGTEPMQKKEGRQEELAIQESWDYYKIVYEASAPQKAGDLMHRKIEEIHRQKKKSGIDYAEVDIITVWEQIMNNLHESGEISEIDPKLIPDIIVDFVIRYDQPWPMPGLVDTLIKLREKNIERGIISNSQFYSPLTLEALCEQSLEEMGFNSALCFWSFAEDIAKPSVHFYEIAKSKLAKDFNIQPHQVLFVGNDMLKDIYPADKAGFRTALFAGDIRSLRWWEDDERCRNLKPDVTLTALEQVLDCVE